MSLPWIAPHAPADAFPDVETAYQIPNGLLCAGSDLSAQRLVAAYRRGIFPWFNEGDPVLWWSPDPRCVLQPENIKIRRSLRRKLPQFQVLRNQNFAAVIRACAAPRKDQDGTWILPEMQSAYQSLHEQGVAHSIEVYQQGELVGGLYGLRIGALFCGESMFSRVSDASKVALVALAQTPGIQLIDCQMATHHLLFMGAQEWPRKRFLQEIARLIDED